jgi:DNA repair exonuclease SbcCD ATPase subunit
MVPQLRHPKKMALKVHYYNLEAIKREARGEHDQAAQYRQQAAKYAAALRHAGRCLECGRELEDEASIERGVGPDCAAKLRRAERRAS